MNFIKKISGSLLSTFISMSMFAQTGIGTTSPINKLQVETVLADPATSGAAANGILRLSGTSGSHVLDFGLSSSNSVSWVQSRSKSAYGTNFNLALNPNGGNVGIGTMAPTTVLHIQNGNTTNNDPSSNLLPSIYVYNTNGASTLADAVIAMRTNGLNGGNPYVSFDVNGVAGFSMGIKNATGQLAIINNWNFSNSSTIANNQMIFNRTGQSRVIIPEKGGSFMSDWPSGWGGGLATFDILCASIWGGSYLSRSDRRLKNTIDDLSQKEINKYLNLRPVSFFWNKPQTKENQKQFGLIAQEVEQIFPEMIQTSTDSMQTKAVNYQALHALTLAVVQNQQKQIESLIAANKKINRRLQLINKQLKK